MSLLFCENPRSIYIDVYSYSLVVAVAFVRVLSLLCPATTGRADQPLLVVAGAGLVRRVVDGAAGRSGVTVKGEFPLTVNGGILVATVQVLPVRRRTAVAREAGTTGVGTATGRCVLGWTAVVHAWWTNIVSQCGQHSQITRESPQAGGAHVPVEKGAGIRCWATCTHVCIYARVAFCESCTQQQHQQQQQ
jgi:hypothetical protein